MPDKLLSAAGHEFLAGLELPGAARERIEIAVAMIEALDRQLAPLERGLRQLARRQRGCRALMRQFGIGELTAPPIVCELGDVTRLSAARKAVRCAGLDIGAYRSDRRSRVGKLTQCARDAMAADRSRAWLLRVARKSGMPQTRRFGSVSVGICIRSGPEEGPLDR